MAQSRSSKAYTTDLRAPYVVGHGESNTPSTDGAIDSGYVLRAKSATAGNPDIPLLGSDAEDNLMVGGSAGLKPTWQRCTFKAVANGNVVTTRFHVFNVSGRIKRIVEIHTTAGTAGGAVTLHVTKERGVLAPGAGTTVMSGTFNLKGTADTLQTATLSTTASDLEFVAGDMLSVKLTGTATTAAGVFLEVYVQYDLPVFETSWYSAAATSTDQCFFIANRVYPIRAIRYVHAVAETTDTTANVQVTVDDGTEAPGAGTDLLTNDSSAGFDINATANVVQTGAFTATTMIESERLGLDFNSTQTEGAGICITACFNTEEAGRSEVSWWLVDTDVLDAWIFIADRSYEIYDGRFLHAVAAGGTATANIEKARSTTTASGGTAMLNTAINLNATANTIQTTDLVSTLSTRQLSSSERMSIDYANTEASLAGLCFTISLRTR